MSGCKNSTSGRIDDRQFWTDGPNVETILTRAKLNMADTFDE